MDLSNPVSSAISGGFSMLGNYLNYKYNQRLAEQQNAYNIDMWKMQNEYNSPANQMRRYEEAGLNPALLAGQITPGNASSAPEQVTPGAPDYSKDMSEMVKAFNIEGLRTAIANRRKAQAESKLSEIAAENSKNEREAMSDFGDLYEIDPDTGMYRFKSTDVSVEANAPRWLQKIKQRTGAYSNRAYYFNKILENNFRTNSLLAPRGMLIGSQRLLNEDRRKLLAPQIQMQNYAAKNYPISFWLGNARTGVGIATDIGKTFLPYY